MESPVRIVVVGAGIIGLACAYELAKDGHQVTTLDAGRPGYGASVGSAAKIALAECAPVPAPGMVIQGLTWMLDPDGPLYVRPSLRPDFVRFMISMARHCNAIDFRRSLDIHLGLAHTSVDVLAEWKDDGMSFEEHGKGVILAYGQRVGFDDRRRYDDSYATYGYVPEVLDAAALHEREPCLSDRIRHGLFYPRDRQIEPKSLTEALAKRLAELGHAVLPHQAAIAFERRHGRIHAVRTETATHPADLVVLAAGVACGQLSRALGSPIPVRPGKGYSVDYPRAPTALRTPLTFEDAHVAVTPLDGMLRIAGTMEFTGIETTVRPRRVEAMKRSAAAGFGDWDDTAQYTTPWTGLRPMTPDGLPVVGPLPGLANVLAASGHGMLGLTLAPSTAKAISSLARHEVPGELLRSVSPDRFVRSRLR